MIRFAQPVACGVLLALSALHAGCGNSASGLTTGTAETSSEKGFSNDDPMARPAHVGWIAARGKRCGFYFDPAKLKATYLGYEGKQGHPAAHMAKIEQTYETTFNSTLKTALADPDYCNERRATDIKAELSRHLGGDFTPNFPKPKPVASCGFLGCTMPSEEPFDSKKFWTKRDQENVRK
jgi:hypothetical protein